PSAHAGRTTAAGPSTARRPCAPAGAARCPAGPALPAADRWRRADSPTARAVAIAPPWLPDAGGAAPTPPALPPVPPAPTAAATPTADALPPPRPDRGRGSRPSAVPPRQTALPHSVP